MKAISIMLILMGLYLMINSEDSQEQKPKHRKIQYHEKYKHEKLERLVEIVDPNWDVKHPKKN